MIDQIYSAQAIPMLLGKIGSLVVRNDLLAAELAEARREIDQLRNRPLGGGPLTGTPQAAQPQEAS